MEEAALSAAIFDMMTYEEFASVPVMDAAYKKTRTSKRKKKPEAIFEANETENLIKLCDWLLSGNYSPANLDAFMIFEPKKREINAPAFRDKIVQRNLTDNVVYPALAPSIPFNAFAAQTGRVSITEWTCWSGKCEPIFFAERQKMRRNERRPDFLIDLLRNGITLTVGLSRAIFENVFPLPIMTS